MQCNDLEKSTSTVVPGDMTITTEPRTTPPSSSPSTFQNAIEDAASRSSSTPFSEELDVTKLPQQNTSPPTAKTEPRSPDRPTPSPNESVRSWLQRISLMQSELQRRRFEEGVAQSLSLPPPPQPQPPPLPPPSQPSSRVVKYQDLPYMGEMTLDNSKPRRGRKPKKADICHLIYKNYGTIFPGTPKDIITPDAYKPKGLAPLNSMLPKSTALSVADTAQSFEKSSVQNKIISSLLEKRLTQGINRKRNLKSLLTSGEENQNEPLNLCVRDSSQAKHVKKSSSSNHVDDCDESDTISESIKSEPASDDEVEFVHETLPSFLSESNSAKPVPLTSESPGCEDPDLAAKLAGSPMGPGGYVYWPNAGVFIHPMALQSHLLYYQRLAANNNYTLPNFTPPKSQTSSETPSPTTTASPEAKGKEYRKLVPKHAAKTQDHGAAKTSTFKTPESSEGTKRSSSQSSSAAAATKRKRSAIFIPPIPAENQTNPATEVSICKFKFTGGAKPSLQEKKMLSVDSGGNFRYYSGTGDKSMRGYEFFPRETLQQQASSSQGSSAGAFLQATGEKIPLPLPNAGALDAAKPHHEFLGPEAGTAAAPSMSVDMMRHRKRKTKKSMQREKLEQTFKEKGFLIQTQQLESAEGATYCKFRQLRKFTRYLFRSWKDYLPGNVRELQEGERSVDEDENSRESCSTSAMDLPQPDDLPKV